MRFRIVSVGWFIGNLSSASLSFLPILAVICVFSVGIASGKPAPAQTPAVPAPNPEPVSAPNPASESASESESKTAPIVYNDKNAESGARAAAGTNVGTAEKAAGTAAGAAGDAFANVVVRRDVYSGDVAFFEFANGLRALVERTNERRAAIRFYFGEAGTGDEREYAGSGVAALTARLVVGRARVGESAARFARLGAFPFCRTTRDGALLGLDASASEFGEAFAALADVVKNPVFDDASLEAERRKSAETPLDESAARAALRDRLTAETAYSVSTAFREPPEGRPDLRAALTPENVLRFFETRYSPNRTIVAVACPLDPENVARAIAAEFANVPRGVEYRAASEPEPRQVSRRDAVAEFNGTRAELVVVWQTVAADDPDAPVFDLLAELATGGKNSRLTRAAVDGAIDASEVAAVAVEPVGERGTFELRATVAPNRLAAAEKALVAELRTFAESLSDAELEAAKKLASVAFARRTRNPADDLETRARALAATGDPDFERRRLDAIRAVDAETVRRVVRERFGDVYSRIAIVPTGTGPRFVVPPNAEATRTFDRLETLPNGARLRTLVRRGEPLVEIRIVALAGALVETPETAGRTELLGELLDKGSAKYGRDAIAQYFDSIGGTFDVEVGRNAIALVASVLREDFADAFDVLLDAATRPTLDPDEFDRAKERRAKAIVAALDADGGSLFALFSRAVPQESTFAVPTAGTPETLAATTLDDLKTLQKRVFSPRNLVVGIAGDVAELDALREAAEKVRALPPSDSFLPIDFDRPSAPLQAIRRVKTNARANAGNALFAAAIPTVDDEADLAALTVLQEIWANRFKTGRLDVALADLGANVSVQVDLLKGPTPGYMTIWLTTAPRRLYGGETRIRAAVERSLKTSFSEKECADAKKRIDVASACRYATIQERLKRTTLDDLYRRKSTETDPERRDALFRAAIDATTPQDVERVAERYWRRDQIVFVAETPEAYPVD